MVKKFNMTLYPQVDNTNLLFDGFIEVDESTKLITGIYENSAPTVNVILPTNDPDSFPSADNSFNGFFSDSGVNFTSDKIMAYYSGLTSNHFNLYSNLNIYQDITEHSYKLYGTIIGESSIDSSMVLNQTIIDNFTSPINIVGGTADKPTVITLTQNINIDTKTLNFYIAEDQHVIFNGCGYSIDIANINGYRGLFISNSKFIKIENLAITNDTDTSTISIKCGWFSNNFFSGTIENCYTTASNLGNFIVGGFIVGNFAGSGDVSGYCKINNCHSTGSIQSNSGGICGNYPGVGGECIISNCYSTGDLDDSSGGISGSGFGNREINFLLTNTKIRAVISNCYSTGAISGIGSGGIVGSNPVTGVIGDSICEINSSYSIGAIQGFGSGGIVGTWACFNGERLLVTNCYSTGNITGVSSGGIVGSSNGTVGILTVENCYSTGNIPIGCGGIVGTFLLASGGQCNINNCYTTGTLSVGGFGIVNIQYGAIVDNSFHSPTGWNDTEGVTYLVPNNVWKKVSIPSLTTQPWKIYSNLLGVQLTPLYTEGILVYRNLFPNIINNFITVTVQLTDKNGNPKSNEIDGTNISYLDVQYSGGDNEFYVKIITVDDVISQSYYKVGEYLNYIRMSTITSDITITQSNLNNYNYPIRVLGDTTVTIGENIVCPSGKSIGFSIPDNQNVTITGTSSKNTITITDVSNWIGLASVQSTLVNIENIGLISDSSYLNFDGSVGWFIGNKGYCMISNCYSTGEMSPGSSGGIAGNAFASGPTSVKIATINNCYSTGVISGIESGGIVSSLQGTILGAIPEPGKCLISNCYSTGIIIGENSGGIASSYAGGSFDIIYPGGECTIINCYSNGDIIGTNSGGITGPNSGSVGTCSISGCYSTGDIIGTNSGGIVGNNCGVSGKCLVTDSYSTGDIEGTNSGGIVGANAAGFDPIQTIESRCTITNCYSAGDINGDSSGGIAGSVGLAGGPCTISNCYSEGNINGIISTGGIAGPGMKFKISNCYVTGIKGNDSFYITKIQGDTTVNNSDHTLGWSDSDATKYLIPNSEWKKVTPTSITNQSWKLAYFLKTASFTNNIQNKTVKYANIYPINILNDTKTITVHLENKAGSVVSDNVVVNSDTLDVIFTNFTVDTNENIYMVIDNVGVTPKAVVSTDYYNAGEYIDYYLYVVPTTTTTIRPTTTTIRPTTTTTTTIPICYNKGTKILCVTNDLEEDYVPIENIKKGMLVKTYKHGYRRVELIGTGNLINNINKPESCMYILPRSGSMIDNLIITGGHSILVDNYPNKQIKEIHNRALSGNTKIDDKYLLVAGLSGGVMKPINTRDRFTYYHLVLESDGDNEARYGIWANGILSESVSKSEFIKRNYKS